MINKEATPERRMIMRNKMQILLLLIASRLYGEVSGLGYLADILFAGKVSKVLKNLNPRLIERKRHRQDDRRCKFHVFR